MRACTAGGSGWSCDRSSDRYSLTKGLCKTHYAQLRRGSALAPINRDRACVESSTCEFDACSRTVSAKGLCTAHYQQRSKGQSLSPLRKKRSNGVYRAMVERGAIDCLGCGESKPISEYSTIDAAGARRPYCKPCNAERVRLGNYNGTKEFVDRLLEFQGGRCAVCGTHNSGTKAMHIDHDHACCPGRRSCGACVRGLLCSNCNWRGLAWYESLPSALRTFDLLNAYLAHPPAQQLRAQSAATREG